MNSVQRVRQYLAPYGVEIREFNESTHTSELTARAVGVEVGQIAKPLLFTAGIHCGREFLCGGAGNLVSAGRYNSGCRMRSEPIGT